MTQSSRSEAPSVPDEAIGDLVDRRGVRRRSVLAAAADAGLLHHKSGRITGRVSPALVERAKAVSNLSSDSSLIEYALASLAIEDGFPAAFEAARGAIDADLDLGI